MKRTVATVIAFALAATTAFGATSTMTEAARSQDFNLRTEFKFKVEDSAATPTLILEHSNNGSNWASTSEQGTIHSRGLTFNPSAMALNVGENNAVYAPMYVRLGKGTTSGAKATIKENRLSTGKFEDALRSRIYVGVDDCSAAGVSGAGIQTSMNMRGQGTREFNLPAPTQDDQPGATVKLCVKTWMADNNWLLGGKTPPNATANWRVTAQQN